MANSLSGCAQARLMQKAFRPGYKANKPSIRPTPNSYPEGFSATVRRNRPLATRPSPGRVRPVWNSAVSRSDERGASRHETSLGEPPERDEQLAGERHDHHSADPSTGPRSALVEPLAERAIRLIAQPAPRHLDELCPDPCWTVAADPLVALRVSARPRGWRHTDPARVFATIAEPAVEDLVRQDGFRQRKTSRLDIPS